MGDARFCCGCSQVCDVRKAYIKMPYPYVTNSAYTNQNPMWDICRLVCMPTQMRSLRMTTEMSRWVLAVSYQNLRGGNFCSRQHFSGRCVFSCCERAGLACQRNFECCFGESWLSNDLRSCKFQDPCDAESKVSANRRVIICCVFAMKAWYTVHMSKHLSVIIEEFICGVHDSTCGESRQC